MGVIDGLIEGFIRGAVRKAAQGFADKGEIAQAQVTTLTEGVMIEVQIALEMWHNSQKGDPASHT